jgi:hypothetical protein
MAIKPVQVRGSSAIAMMASEHEFYAQTDFGCKKGVAMFAVLALSCTTIKGKYEKGHFTRLG